MLIIIVLLLAGILCGFLLRKKKRVIILADKLTNWTIYLLLLLLGIAIGSNKKIINNIGNIGINAIIIALGTIIGSILVSYIVYLLYFKKAKDEK
ncbi:MAG: LysO family transporter [bacterium]|nr:LysO family transporter [bacterium]